MLNHCNLEFLRVFADVCYSIHASFSVCGYTHDRIGTVLIGKPASLIPCFTEVARPTIGRAFLCSSVKYVRLYLFLQPFPFAIHL